MKNKIRYFLRSGFHYFSKRVCPYCNGVKVTVIDRKYFVTTLLKCNNCGFQFRHPRDRDNFNTVFYQAAYKEIDGITTDLPEKDKLRELIKSNFIHVGKNADRYIEIIKNLNPAADSISVLDYGCNWGYTSFQFKKAGFEVTSYEISEKRASYGNENLGLNIFTKYEDVKGKVDVFFSAHVIEHHPDVAQMLQQAKDIINPGGYFIAFCPNGSAEYQKQNPLSFHLAWGLVHPNFLDKDFFHTIFKDMPYLMGSNYTQPEEVIRWDQNSQVILDLSGVELFIIVKI